MLARSVSNSVACVNTLRVYTIYRTWTKALLSCHIILVWRFGVLFLWSIIKPITTACLQNVCIHICTYILWIHIYTYILWIHIYTYILSRSYAVDMCAYAGTYKLNMHTDPYMQIAIMPLFAYSDIHSVLTCTFLMIMCSSRS
jgi:hypothetical protein